MPALGAATDGTPITWAASGGTRVITLASVANGAGRIGAQHDRTAGVQPTLYLWELEIKCATAPTLRRGALLFVAQAHTSALVDGNLGTADAAVSSRDRLANLLPCGVVIIDEANAARSFKASGLVEITARYFSPVVWNDTAVAFSSTATDFTLRFTPVAPATY